MSVSVENRRRREKRTTTPGVVPTIPINENHTSGDWLDTDIYEGELFINLGDSKMFTRIGGSIIPLGGIPGSFVSKTGDTMSDNLLFNGNKGIDSTVTGGTDVLNIGVTNAEVINIGNAGTVVNIYGTRNFISSVDLEVEDKLFRINKGGAVATGFGAGFEIEENSIVTGYFKTNGSRNGFSLLSPAIAYSATISLASLASSDKVFTLPNTSGQFALGSGTQNKLSKWNNTGGTTLGDSQWSDDGTTTAFTGVLNIPTSSSSTVGVINQNGTRFINTYGLNNFFAGSSAGNFTLTGNGLIGIGAFALTSNGSGTKNVGVGFAAIGTNVIGTNNTAVGYFALSTATTSNNSAFGASSLAANSTGHDNSAFGSNSLTLHTTGSFNSAFGVSSLGNSTTGFNNTAIGYQSGFSVTTGSNNTFLGYNTDSAGANTNSIALGSGAVINANNQIVFGKTTTPVNKWRIAGIDYVMMPSQGGVNTFIKNDGSGNLTWSTVATLPTQTSNTNKVLTTDGTNASWSFLLKDAAGFDSVEYDSRILSDDESNKSLGWFIRELYYSGGTTVSIGWDNSVLNDLSGLSAVNYSTRILSNSSEENSVDWDNRRLYRTNTDYVLDWNQQQLLDSGIRSIDWTNRALFDNSNVEVLNWLTNTITASTPWKYLDGNQAAGYILTSDASGNATWQGLGAISPTTVTGTSTTDATSTTVAAFKTAGGLGVAKQLWIGTNLTFTKQLNHTILVEATTAGATAGGDLTIQSGIGTSNGGQIFLYGGNGAGGVGGNFNVFAGNGLSGQGGNILLDVGTGSTVNGQISLGSNNLPTLTSLYGATFKIKIGNTAQAGYVLKALDTDGNCEWQAP